MRDAHEDAVAGPAAVYERGIGYDDEHFYLAVDRHLDEELGRWRRGESSAFAERFARGRDHDDADGLVSVHATIAEAEQAARAVHAERVRSWTFADLGFHLFGCRPVERWFPDEDEPEWTPGLPDDLDRLTAWCRAHDVEVPGLEPDDPAVRAACERIAARAHEGDLWLDCWDEDGGRPFAADLVAERLIAGGRADMVPELWRHLVGEFAYVGPAPGGARPGGAPDAPPPKPGVLRRLFGS